MQEFDIDIIAQICRRCYEEWEDDAEYYDERCPYWGSDDTDIVEVV